MGPCYGAVRFYFASQKMIQEGHRKYAESGIFKVPRWTSWLIIVDSDQLVGELYQMPEEILSERDSNSEENQTKYTMGETIYTNPYHVPLLRSKLPRHNDLLGAECLDEIPYAFEEVIGRGTDESWRNIDIVKPLTNVVARTSSRFIVGEPLCRDESYISVALQSGPDIVIKAFFINLFPSIFRPISGRLLTNLPAKTRALVNFLGPAIEERKALAAETKKDLSTRHQDVLSELMQVAPPEEQAPEAIARRVMAANAAAFHSLSLTCLNALVTLATRPEYVPLLRAEVEDAIQTHGWGKNAMDQLPKLDSFLKESMRFNVLGSTSLPRRAREPFSFSDGTYIPRGTYVATTWSNHFDEQHYPGATSFDGLRFYKESSSSGQGRVNEVIRTSPYYQPFGHGKHVWYPGRFVASCIMKGVLAHILLNYDVKMGGDGTRPRDIWFKYYCSPALHIP
ncbi:cytochrome P450 [Gloeophyllum trabeum ATCC 11539]|uniref:Cytochrome P450 n=1 Tax=Gloeophyllum trabeum (strain ATCC 11539 / FP-39264 / Madison 617) TaxID=670483 RepID=S7PS20_GLOTA|nr:cytochrome P450 [Gloeophyllum trabeum ATCC 11539]EPQ50606.1 cytochrome P450 [Gloeophyllum trabeum ATCC 11539]